MENIVVMDNARLSKSEMAVLRGVASGLSAREVASRLCISPRTAEFHIARVYDKLRASNRIQVVRRAVALGLISVPGMSRAA